MKSIKFLLAILLLAGIVGVNTAALSADDGVLLKVRFGTSNYCHMKFPAIREGTLGSAHPVLKHPSSGDIIDFYGPCNYDPTGKEARWAQRIQHLRAQLRAGE